MPLRRLLRLLLRCSTPRSPNSWLQSTSRIRTRLAGAAGSYACCYAAGRPAARSWLGAGCRTRPRWRLGRLRRCRRRIRRRYSSRRLRLPRPRLRASSHGSGFLRSPLAATRRRGPMSRACFASRPCPPCQCSPSQCPSADRPWARAGRRTACPCLVSRGGGGFGLFEVGVRGGVLQVRRVHKSLWPACLFLAVATSSLRGGLLSTAGQDRGGFMLLVDDRGLACRARRASMRTDEKPSRPS
ncbi:hypothetical protein B0T26DRAFT_761836 [Lasiosphaeria miniovina]|uniref:Uncharacterized protein n=1 Tax=Lasiosphaeria miniovina TaxID=1954250 RepID=A0AA40EGI5_9PEZI|nr:uncharacterized protein B0T26DRAFT_761836 [Lasiosphaeria miniovina]KAK0734568.1 hypothetical protein B0T26DRAFT_761836 [Lasiosphaeria miniovina]